MNRDRPSGACPNCNGAQEGALSSIGDTVIGGLAFSFVLTAQCTLSAFLGSSVWTPCVTGVFSVASYMMLSTTPGIDCAGEQAPAVRIVWRPLLAGALLGFTVMLMLGQFLGCGHGKANPNTWMFGFFGVAFAAIAQIAVRRLRGTWDPFVACWPVASLIVVAFYPMNAGSDFSLKFAVAVTTFALWSAAAVLPSTLSAFALKDGSRPAACCLAFSIGLVAAGAAGGPLGYFAAMTSFEDKFVLVSAVCSMVLGFVALTLVLNRPLRFSRDEVEAAPDAPGAFLGKTEAPATQVLDGSDGLAHACTLIASECGLTPRECDVFAVLARGYDVARVQEELSISEGTALTHKRHIYQKLGVHTRAELLDRVREK